ncbi:ZIP family metal transporter [Haladaptatus sp. DJG-WS-42]|uniref:ZIP family metal transporter n=1 Tax=Haladaptatus sp. DJG-WS-42 TaxID=3120516 RepID=UPI0030D164A6
MSQPGVSAPARTYVGYAGVLAFIVLSGLAVTAGLWKVLTIGWVAFAAMAGAAIPGKRAAASKHAGRLVWGYGLAAGAMVTSAAVFLLPQAFGFDPKIGGFGVAAGILLGFASHTVGHRLAHLDLPFDATTAHLTAHSLTAGIIIGVVYATLPELGLVLGLAIVSHKGPAGYAAARRLAANDKSTSIILLPAAGVGITAILSGLVAFPESAQLNAAVFGFAAGIFLHIAMDFLPRCEVGGEVGEVAKLTDDAHALLDRLRVHAVISTSLGAFAVLLAWLAVA